MFILLWIIGAICTFFILHQSVITITSWFVKGSEITEVENPVKRFVCLVCAHNESAVVSQIIKTLLAQNYPKDLYDIVVIADNCEDDTAAVSLDAGAQVWERFDDEKKSKGYALEWAFNKMWEGDVEYDAVCVFDADNLISANFLKEMDAQMQSGAEVIQGYLDSKNPKDTWISKSYAFSYWATNRIFQLAREKVGLSAQLGGTGMCISTTVLKEHPWGTESMTEDLEYVARYVISSGKPVKWAHNAKIYDEKPLKMKASWIQRTRWARGHIDCAYKYSGQLFKRMWQAIKERDFKAFAIAFDVFVYLIQPSRIVISGLSIAFFVYTIYMSGFNFGERPYFWLTLMVLYYGIPFVGIIQERQTKSILWFGHVVAFAFTWIPIFAIAFFTRKKKTWNKTIHTRSVSMEDVNISQGG